MASSALSRGKSGKDDKRSSRAAPAEKARPQPWRADEVAALRSLARKKLTPAQIARELNRAHGKARTRETVEVYCARHDIKLPAVRKTAAPRAATPAKSAKQAAPARPARSAAVSKPVPSPKRAAAGQATAKLKAPPVKAESKPKPPKKVAKEAPKPSVVERLASVAERVASVIERAGKSERRTGSSRGTAKPAARRPIVAPAPHEAPERGPVALADLRLQDCRWPLGGLYERTTLFCGKQHQPGSPYCPEHHARSLGRSSGPSSSEAPNRFAKTG